MKHPPITPWARTRRWFSDLEARGVDRLRAESTGEASTGPDHGHADAGDTDREGMPQERMDSLERATAEQILLLTRNLPVAATPAALASPEFLDGILDRALRASEPVIPLDTLLQASAPTGADSDSVPPGSDEMHGASLEGAFPHLHQALEHWAADAVPQPAEPTWESVTASVRQDLAQFRSSGSRLRRRRVGIGFVLAASLVLASLYGIRGGTPELASPVFVELDVPPLGDMFGTMAVRRAATPI